MTRRELTLALVTTFFLLALVGRVVLHRLRQGDWGVRRLSGRVGSPSWWGGVCFLASVVCTPLALWFDAAPTLSVELAATLAVVGLAVTLLAQAQMRASWRIGVRPGERTALVTGGLFRVVRNPIFSGMFLFSAGVVALWPNTVSALAALLLLVGVELQVRFVEEPALGALHGEAWRAWARRVGRFVPLVGRLRS